MRYLLTALIGIFMASASAAHAGCSDVGYLQEGITLYHGTPTPDFNWRGSNPKPVHFKPDAPDGPAWFSTNLEFAIHAGLRYAAEHAPTTLSVHQYTTKESAAVLECDTHKEMFDLFNKDPDDVSDPDFAAAFCNTYKMVGEYNGYSIKEDQVRHEHEYILCRPALKLTKTGAKVYDVDKSDELIIARSKNENTFYVLNPTDITSFQVIAH